MTRRGDALFELTDAMLCENGPVTSPVDLTLPAEHRRGHGALYDALNHGRIDAARLRRALAVSPQPKAADNRLVLAVDVSHWLRPDAPCSADRLFVPRPTGLGPMAPPSCCQAAPKTIFPRHLNSVSSTATVSTAPSGSRRRTTRWDSDKPRMSGCHREREKKACARSWDQRRVNPAPVSIPVTVHRPVCAISPTTSAAKVRNVGVVKPPRTNSNTASSEAVPNRWGPARRGGPRSCWCQLQVRLLYAANR